MNLEQALHYSNLLNRKKGSDSEARGGDIQKILGSSKISFPWSKYKNELHLPFYNFAGPGTALEKRLDENDMPLENSKPINRVDAAAYKHDLAYRDHSDIKSRHAADKEMITELDNIENPTFKERVARMFVKKILQAKMAIGQGVNDKIFADEKHKQFKKSKHLLKVKVFAKDDIWSADLISMPNEQNFKYCLTVIDLYTRYAWIIPLKTKTAKEVKQAFENIFKESKRRPNKLFVDKGSEFYNKEVKPLFKTVYSTENFGKSPIIERFNRTIKNKLFKKFTELNSQKWLKILPQIVKEYNNKIHSSIGETPVNASKNPDLIRDKIMEHNFSNENNPELQHEKPKFKVGDRVRIFKYKNIFEKGYYRGYWTSEIFEVDEVLKTFPITYKIKDLENEEIKGRFYGFELSHTSL